MATGKIINEGNTTGNYTGTKGYTGFIIPKQWEAKKRALQKSISKTTGYIMVGEKNSDDLNITSDVYNTWSRPNMNQLKNILKELKNQLIKMV